MRRGSAAVLCLLLSVTSASAEGGAGRERALSAAAEVERIASQLPLWPGFEPLGIPLAVYAGGHTYLFRHPSPPEGFTPIAGSVPAALVFEGRHPAVTANSSAPIGGVPTATVMADAGGAARLSPTALAVVALHESFHVFQRRVHPGWQSNEGDLFLYPADQADSLADRRLETEALRRALDAGGGAATCWARVAMAHRQARFARLGAPLVAYERATEWNEGLASYVQLLAERRTSPVFPATEFAPAEVRARTYVSGPALALLLDRLAPGWQQGLERDDTQPLDVLLASALDRQPATSAETCGFAEAELGAVRERAAHDAGALVASRRQAREAFDTRPGWRVTVRAARGEPLWPKGFDPLNVETVPGGVLHRRMLRLGNGRGEVSVLDDAGADLDALTVAAGEHPLFNGIRELVVAGLARPDVEARDGHVALRAPGLEARFAGASVHVEDGAVVVQLPASP